MAWLGQIVVIAKSYTCQNSEYCKLLFILTVSQQIIPLRDINDIKLFLVKEDKINVGDD